MKTKWKDVNLHELNKYLKNHKVSFIELDSIIQQNPKIMKPKIINKIYI